MSSFWIVSGWLSQGACLTHLVLAWQDYILVVPEDIYSSQYLQEEPLDKSYDFISSCGINSFYIK